MSATSPRGEEIAAEGRGVHITFGGTTVVLVRMPSAGASHREPGWRQRTIHLIVIADVTPGFPRFASHGRPILSPLTDTGHSEVVLFGRAQASSIERLAGALREQLQGSGGGSREQPHR